MGKARKIIAVGILVGIFSPLTGQGYEYGCEPLGCGYEVRKLKERVRELEEGEVRAPRYSIHEQEEARRLLREEWKERDKKERKEREGYISPFSGKGRIHEEKGQ